MRVVVSLTTLPERAHLLERTIESLRHQTYRPDAIYLWLPEERFGAGYAGHQFPDVQTRSGPDLGPAMKILPLLPIETDPETFIIPVDDDVEYPPELIERLVRAAWLHPDQAIGFTGWILSPDDSGVDVRHMNEEVADAAMFQPVHVLEGYRGVIYRRGFFEFDILDHLAALPAFRLHDDILLSGYLASRGVGRMVRWYGATPATDRWVLHGQEIGLHTTPGWLEQGRACVDYWRARAPDAFPAIPTTFARERLQLCAASCPRAGFTHHATTERAGKPDGAKSLNEHPWPWADAQFREILAIDPDHCLAMDDTDAGFAGWLDECLRILQPGGHLMLRLPAAIGCRARAQWGLLPPSPSTAAWNGLSETPPSETSAQAMKTSAPGHIMRDSNSRAILESECGRLMVTFHRCRAIPQGIGPLPTKPAPAQTDLAVAL